MTQAELYREVSGSGEPILLIHGNGANTRIWVDPPTTSPPPTG